MKWLVAGGFALVAGAAVASPFIKEAYDLHQQEQRDIRSAVYQCEEEMNRYTDAKGDFPRNEVFTAASVVWVTYPEMRLTCVVNPLFPVVIQDLSKQYELPALEIQYRWKDWKAKS